MTSAQHPHTASLPGFEPPPPRNVPLRVAVVGTLATAAAVRLTTEGHPVLEVLLDQAVPGNPQAVPVLARLRVFGNADPGGDQLDAQQRASRMPRGCLVAALGAGVAAGVHNGEPVLRLLGVVNIGPCDPAIAPQAAAATPPVFLEADHVLA